MYRSRTVREIERRWEQRVKTLEQQNTELLDRIMYLTGKEWAPPPTPPLPDPRETEPILFAEDFVS